MDRRAVLSLLRHRAGFRRLWAAESLSSIGDWFSIVAVSVLSLGPSGDGVLALALTLGAHLLPQALLAPIAGSLADRVDRRRVLIVASVIEGVLTLAMVFAASAGAIGVLQLLLLARAATSALRPPASGAALPALVAPEQIAPANAVNAISWSVCFAIGMSLGGVATEWSPIIALSIDAFTFFGAAFVLFRLPSLPAPGASGAALRALPELREALRIGTGSALRAAVFGKTPLALAAGAGWIGLNLVAQAHPDLGGSATTLGGLQALRGIGTGVGPVLALAWIVRGVARRSVEHLAAAAALIGVVLVGLVPGGIAVFVATLLWGAGAGANWVLTTSRIQERAPREFLGRLLALDALLYALSMSAGALVAALSIESGIELGASAAGAALAGAIGWLWLGGEPSAPELDARVGIDRSRRSLPR